MAANERRRTRRAVVEQLHKDGAWRICCFYEGDGVTPKLFENRDAALTALVRMVHESFADVMAGRRHISDIPEPERLRVSEIQEH